MSPPVCLIIARDESLDRRASVRDAAPARRQRRSACGNALLRIALGRATGTSPDVWSTGRTERGAPVVTGGPRGAARMHVSLSHSGPYLAAAASAQGPVGVDVEVVRERRYAGIARHLGWPARTWADGLSHDAFFHLWTLWEASIKLAPSGSRPGPPEIFAEITRSLDTGRPVTVTAGPRIARSWRCADRAWLSLVAEPAGEVRLFRLRSPAADGRHAEVDELDASRESLDLA